MTLTREDSGIAAADVELAVEDSGGGFPVVYIHGLGGSGNVFEAQITALTDFRSVRIDLPGSGRSGVPQGTLSIESMASAVSRCLSALGITRFCLVGHSLGSLVCQALAVREPTRVAAMVLIGAIAEPSDAARTGLRSRAALARRVDMAQIADQIVTGALSRASRASNPAAVVAVRELIMRQHPEGYARTCEALSEAQAYDLSGVTAPVLLIAGGADPVSSAETSRFLASKLSDARLAVIEDVGHWIPIEAAQSCSNLIAEFFSERGIAR
ncbi:alpha/beta hydrolase [Mesorhizobium sp. M1169]|uniref:alpha/beta fold hydrolase n=1 Tax=Mesorhizobium sp. M1169 TaxID=2957066 RepID=UPI00333688B7